MTGFGYLPFDYGFDSDHRGMFIDISSKDVNELQASGRRRRKLKSKNPKSVKSYLKMVTKLVKSLNIEARVAKLEGKPFLNETDKEELEIIDQTFMEILLHAESKLQIHRTDDAFSDKLHEAKKSATTGEGFTHYPRQIPILR